MNTNNINIPFGQIFILTNPQVGITSKTTHMMGFILSMARQYSKGHILHTLPVDDPELWDCFICKVKTVDGDQILVSDKDTLVEMLCEFWGLNYDKVCKSIVIPKRNKTFTCGGEKHPVRVSLKPVGESAPELSRKEGTISMEFLQDHSREKTLLDIRSTFKDNFNFGLGITLEEVLAIYKEEQALKKTYKLDIKVRWKKYEEFVPGKGMVKKKKMTACDIRLIDNLGTPYLIKLEAMAKAIYLTYLLFENGIAYSQITDSEEFYNIFKQIYMKLPWSQGCPDKFNLEERADLDTFTNYISKIRKAIQKATNDTYAVEQFAVEGWRKDDYRIAGATVENRDVVRKEFRIK